MAKRNDDQPVALSKIYTRTRDHGTTPLGGTSRTAQTDPRAARSPRLTMEPQGDTVTPRPASPHNRLSDLLFILCRVANSGHGDVLWKPGSGHGPGQGQG